MTTVLIIPWKRDPRKVNLDAIGCDDGAFRLFHSMEIPHTMKRLYRSTSSRELALEVVDTVEVLPTCHC